MRPVSLVLAAVVAAPASADEAQRAAIIDLIRASDCYIEVAALDDFLKAGYNELGLGISDLMTEVQILIDEGVAEEKPSGDLRLSRTACAEGYQTQ